MTEPDAQKTLIAVAVVEQDDRLLIGLRPAGTALAGYWEFPGGKFLAGETPEDAAVRECWEETGLQVQPLGVLLAQWHEYPHGRLRLHFVRCQPLDSRHPPLPPFIWVPRASLSQYVFPAGNRTLLDQLDRGPLGDRDEQSTSS